VGARGRGSGGARGSGSGSGGGSQGLRTEYPELEDEDIAQALAYAAALLDDQVIDLPNAG
jgi:hypothetical protein